MNLSTTSARQRRLSPYNIATSRSTGVSQCMCRRVSPVNHSVVIDDRIAVLIRFSPLNDHSAEQLVTGSVHKILTKARMLGYMHMACLKVTGGMM